MRKSDSLLIKLIKGDIVPYLEISPHPMQCNAINDCLSYLLLLCVCFSLFFIFSILVKSLPPPLPSPPPNGMCVLYF